jgi:hypothetical protein
MRLPLLSSDSPSVNLTLCIGAEDKFNAKSSQCIILKKILNKMEYINNYTMITNYLKKLNYTNNITNVLVAA